MRDVMQTIEQAPTQSAAIYDLIVCGHETLAYWLVSMLDGIDPWHRYGMAVNNGGRYLGALRRLPNR
jgi:hypothetical protein